MEDRKKGPDPWLIANLEELLAIARSMEQEAIRGYMALSDRMRRENRADLAEVFDALRLEEQGHLKNVDDWVDSRKLQHIQDVEMAEPLFDDEGAAVVAPELLDSYRAFSMAVRNEERAFVFWTYVAAHAPNDEVRQAAERMAREELGHVATLRRERRRAFHDLRRTAGTRLPVDIAALELQLADQLSKRASELSGQQAVRFGQLAEEARRRSASVSEKQFDRHRLPDQTPEAIEGRLVPLCEFLLDCYLAIAERQRDDSAQQQAQSAAGAVLACLHAVRGDS
nr:rubrerythrin family protein [Rhizobium sp. Q54]